jgi:hypothetical protein
VIAAWIAITALGASQPFMSKEIRIEPGACGLPAVRGEYPVNGAWKPVTIRIACKR